MKRLAFVSILTTVIIGAAGCSLSDLPPHCNEGQIVCKSNEGSMSGTLYVCLNGSLDYLDNCDSGCDGDKCADSNPSLCKEGEKQCADNHTQKVCTDGHWSVIPCDNICEDGDCTAKTCEPGAPKCIDDYHSEQCIDGIVQRKECDEGEECRDGECVNLIDNPPPELDNYDETPGAPCDENYITHCSENLDLSYNCVDKLIAEEACIDSKCEVSEGKASCVSQPVDVSCNSDEVQPVCSEDKKSGTYCLDDKLVTLECKEDEICSLDESADHGILCKSNLEPPEEVCDGISGDTFIICSGKGILEYKKQVPSNIKKIKFKGDINLADAEQTKIDESGKDITCEWKDWTPITVPKAVEIYGDNATITHTQGSLRCTLPKSFFYEITGGTIHDIHFDVDYKGIGAAVLIDGFNGSIMENVTITGNAAQLIQGESGVGEYGLIKKASNYKLKNVTVNMDHMSGYGNPMGCVIGNASSGQLDDVHITLNELSNQGANGGLGGIIGWSSKDNTILNTSLIVKKAAVQSENSVFGGLMLQASSEVTAQNVYIQLDELDFPDKSSYSGAVFGKSSSAESKINLSKTILKVGKINGKANKLAGIIGTGVNHLSIKSTLILSDDSLYGTLLGSTKYVPIMNNVVVVSPSNVARINKLPNKNILSELINSFIDDYQVTDDPCGYIDSLYYYTVDGYYTDSSCAIYPVVIKKDDTGSVDDLLNKLNSSSTDITWQLKDLKVADYDLKVPVFEAAGILP